MVVEIDGKKYDVFGYDFSALAVHDSEKNITKACRVIENSEFVYFLSGKKIYARDGFEGLSTWMIRCIDEDFCMALVRKVVKYVLTHGKTLSEVAIEMMRGE